MLVGDKLVLRNWMPSDLPALQVLRNNVPLQMQLMAYAKGSTLEQVQEWLIRRSTSSASVFYVIAEKTTNATIGYVQLLGLDQQDASGCLGICIDPKLQGLGYGTETLALLANHASVVLRLKKIKLQVLADNRHAISLYSKHGFVETHYLKEYFDTGAGRKDAIIMEKNFPDVTPMER